MASKEASSKPFIVSLGDPKYVGEEFLQDFTRDFDFEVLPATNRRETQELLPRLVARGRPIDGFIIRMGTIPYEPFDQDLLGALLPGCKIIASASAGYNEFDVDWMTRNNVW
ncbi:hypothetical protein CLCR_10913 [Cladophialophora carrionii]|uniref:D-isomer specific 2-hydroxyacid dehydrogenase catalytic domain-containing protein n=1 Tax=Cladophialophora carrionii TaxID=86049 RepID=A0A1C1CWB1_9EURO|nr:hypothetical protein CLCR_10913 [Cladophialophora carrionii]